MQYCTNKNGSVAYRFGSGEVKKIDFVKEQTPITVTTGDTKPNDSTPNYNPLGYSIEYFDVYNKLKIATRIIDYYVNYRNPNGTQSQNPYLWYKSCNSDIFRWIGLKSPSVSIIEGSGLCPNSQPVQCTITISDKDGNLLLYEQGECNVVFTVLCTGCPEGQLECEDGCCLDCDLVLCRIKKLLSFFG